MAKQISGGCELTCASGIKCTIFEKASKDQLATADIVVNHHGSVPKKHRDEQIIMYYTGESNHSEPKKSTPQYLAQYDVPVSFHTDREFYFTWTNRFRDAFERVPTKQWPEWNTQLDAIAVFVSRCKKGGRDDLIRKLSKIMTVHSFGKCAQTHKLRDVHPTCVRAKNRYEEKLCVFPKYKFVLALDNSEETDYVTEKVYHALLSGAVPLYRGAPNINDFVPDPKSIINLKDYDSDSKALVERLKAITLDDDVFAWRHKSVDEWSPKFLEHMRHSEPTCDICTMAANRKKC
jgi:hypothetical protein